MARIRVALAVAIATTVVVAPNADARVAAPVRAHIRVVDTGLKLGSGNPLFGAVRSYVDTTDAPHVLVPNTVMGQLVAAVAAWGTTADVSYSAGLGGFVSSIAGFPGGSTGFWALYVDGRASQTGAETTIMKAGQEIVWLHDPDFTTAGPFFLDLDVAKVAGGYRYTVWKDGGDDPVAAAGARITINGVARTTDAHGRLTLRLARGKGATARASGLGAFSSEVIRVVG